MIIIKGYDEFGENLQGKGWKIDEFLGVQKNLEKETKRIENWKGFSLFWAKPLPFLFFPTAFATLEHGLLRSSVVEVWKLPSTLNGSTLEHNLSRLSVAYGQQSPFNLFDSTLKPGALHPKRSITHHLCGCWLGHYNIDK